MNPSAARSSLPIQAAEQIPMPEGFAGQLSTLAAKPNARHAGGFCGSLSKKNSGRDRRDPPANRVANVGLQAFFENLQPGITEAEVAAAVESAIYRQIGRDGIFHSRGWAMVQSGPNSADAGRFNRSTGRRLENGDLVLDRIGNLRQRLLERPHAHRRRWFPKPEVAEILSVVRDAQQAAVDGVRPGVSSQRH